MRAIGGCCLVLLAACKASSPWEAEEDVSAKLVVVADASDGLNEPQDLAFNPEDPDTLWVVNRADDSVTQIFDARGDRRTEHIIDPYALHFMERVSSIAFGGFSTFGTCQDSRNTYNNQSNPDDFMGPALWSSDPAVFGISNPEAVEDLSEMFGGHVDLGSHLDMLHESPLCVGIDWHADNVYWVFDGKDGALVRYDFRGDHGPGYDDHSDGIIYRYVSGQLKRVAGTVGHVVVDEDNRRVLVADTGNARIVALDLDSGTPGRELPKREAGTVHQQMDDAVLTVVVGEGLVRPAGLARIDEHLVVTDAGTGKIHIYTDDGNLVSTLDTGRGDGALAGVYGESLDELWFVDADADEVLLLTP